jgi:hypothetical protein
MPRPDPPAWASRPSTSPPSARRGPCSASWRSTQRTPWARGGALTPNSGLDRAGTTLVPCSACSRRQGPSWTRRTGDDRPVRERHPPPPRRPRSPGPPATKPSPSSPWIGTPTGTASSPGASRCLAARRSSLWTGRTSLAASWPERVRRRLPRCPTWPWRPRTGGDAERSRVGDASGRWLASVRGCGAAGPSAAWCGHLLRRSHRGVATPLPLNRRGSDSLRNPAENRSLPLAGWPFHRAAEPLPVGLWFPGRRPIGKQTLEGHPSTISLILLASSAMTNGLVMTSIPGSR